MSHPGAIACAGCRHFNGRPVDIESALPGLASLSSAYAAVRSEDGICAAHDRYVAATSLCDRYVAASVGALTALRPAPDSHKTSVRAPYR
jgi:hypothetical protein